MRLPEVYLLRKDLQLFTGRLMSSFYINKAYRRQAGYQDAMMFPRHPSSASVYWPVLDDIGRWGRYLIFRFSSCTVLFRMAKGTSLEGLRQHIYPKEQKDAVAIIGLESANAEKNYLVYRDPQQVGRIKVYPKTDIPQEFAYLGLDVMDRSLTAQQLVREAQAYVICRRRPRKRLYLHSFLLDNSVIAWLDLEYVSEVLFVCGLSPYYDMENGLSLEMAESLLRAFRSVYERAVEHLLNETGFTTNMPLPLLFAIYGRDNEKCFACNGEIKLDFIDKRRIYWCKTCQPNVEAPCKK